MERHESEKECAHGCGVIFTSTDQRATSPHGCSGNKKTCVVANPVPVMAEATKPTVATSTKPTVAEVTKEAK